MQRIRLVLRRLFENSLFMKQDKSEFHFSTVAFLGFIVQQGQLLCDPAKIQAAAKWPTQNSWKQLQQFLGFAIFYRRFIRYYSKVAEPLTRLNSILCPFTWPKEAEDDFTCLKVLFTTAPILSHPDPASLWWRWMLLIQGWAPSCPSGAPRTESSTPVLSTADTSPRWRKTKTSEIGSSWP